ncbi:glycosyltransferase [Citricoccus sp. SGAir0253]|uniref:glycosyltransferase n=1 Tax=Citricoccus sp. SGAir0253 TaxID=2567881 RepID=UPI00143D1DEC|nr:glycosyltransferase [Citricoccus sp. SGAir0253]
MVYAPPGALAEVARDAGLDWVAAPAPDDPRPSWSRRLARVVREVRPDMLHVYGWQPGLRTTLGCFGNLPALVSLSPTDVPSLVPPRLPVVVGTPELHRRMTARGHRTHLVEPPVDLELHRPGGYVGTAAARKRWEVPGGALAIVVVAGLTPELERLQAVLEAIRVADRMAATRPVRLLIAGDGEGRGTVERRAAAVNAHHGWTVVQPVDVPPDSASIYEAADIVIGMGSSALRGLAHAKPLVVHGEGGFWRLVDEDSVAGFVTRGWFGRQGAGVRDLAGALEALAGSESLRRRLGDLGRELVQRRYGLDRAAEQLAAAYVDTALDRRVHGSEVRSRARTVVVDARYYAVREFGSAVARERWARGEVMA